MRAVQCELAFEGCQFQQAQMRQGHQSLEGTAACQAGLVQPPSSPIG